ncbi:tRNA-intron lyase [Thermoplasmatales archaeon AK]|nr:tRNA-intron lyase [Thermoplasmatales archaeon AK]
MNSLPKIVSALELNDDLETFFVFRELKSKGLQLKVHGRTIFYRKKSGGRMHGPIIVIKESETISDIDLARSAGGLYAAIDDDFDITMFLSESFVPIGTNPLDRPGFVENNMDMARIVDSQSVPPWMGHDIGGFKVLTNYEISYLTGRARTDPDLEVYNDLVRRGFVVKTGFKYGCNFRAYAGPSSEHAEFLVHVLTGSDQWYKISRAVRVAHGVRKKMLFASKLESGITYTLISRIRDFPEDS